MSTINIKPNTLSGSIKIPPSKSMSHRAIICAGLANGRSKIENVALSDDIIATIKGMKSFGISADIQNGREGLSTVVIDGTDNLSLQNNVIDCNESGSTIRFLIPFAGLVDSEVSYIGRGKLVTRPLNTYYEIFDKQGIEYSNDDGKLPLLISGNLRPGTFEIKGNISSQFITGLLLVLPLLDGDSNIKITTELESKGYVDLTLEMLERFGIKIENNNYKEFIIKGNQKYNPCNYRVEGDYSQIAFFVVAGLIGKDIRCMDINIDSRQGDRAVLDIVKEMGGQIVKDVRGIIVKKSDTHGITIDASQCPDIIPVLSVLAALSKGRTNIINGERLRIKESDRIKAMVTELTKLGANIIETEDGMIIDGVKELKGGAVDSWNDHRIAMSMAIASIGCKEQVTLTGSEAVSKSYPNFWEDFAKLGGQIDE